MIAKWLDWIGEHAALQRSERDKKQVGPGREVKLLHRRVEKQFGFI